MAERRTENPSINWVRTIAAWLVVLGHVRLLFIADYKGAKHSAVQSVAYAATSLGSQSVLVFFTLSGFWVGGAALRQIQTTRFDWARYLVARLARLWIVLLPALALTWLLDAVGAATLERSDIYSSPQMYAGVSPEPTHTGLSLVGNAIFLQDIHVQTFGYNHPLWSLSYEFWYYMLFPAVVLCVGLRGRRHGARALALGIALGAAVIAGQDVLMLAPAWLLGAGAAQLTTSRPAVVLQRLPGRAALAALTVLVMLALRFRNDNGHLGALILGVVVGALLIALSGTTRRQEGPWARFGNALAGSSFSLYAIHMPLICICAAMIVPDVSRRLPMTWESGALLVAMTVGLAALAYLFSLATERHTDRARAWVLGHLQRRTHAPARPRERASTAP